MQYYFSFARNVRDKNEKKNKDTSWIGTVEQLLI